MTVGIIGHYLTLSAILFTIGVFGIFLNRKNVIVIKDVDRAAASWRLGQQSGRLSSALVTSDGTDFRAVRADRRRSGRSGDRPRPFCISANRTASVVEDVNMMKG